MYMKFKKADGRMFYLPGRINCNKYRTKTDTDGFPESVKCFARKKRQKCRTCSLRQQKC
jgi:hypothetical protein